MLRDIGPRDGTFAADELQNRRFVDSPQEGRVTGMVSLFQRHIRSGIGTGAVASFLLSVRKI